MERVIIFGGTGFIGISLASHLEERGMKPVLVARNQPKTKLKYEFAQWDAVTVGDWKHVLKGARAIVNLAGKTVDCIKTSDNCDLILRSRVDSTLAIGKALQEIDGHPPVWVQMSTAHIYGDPPSQLCTETSSYGFGLAPIVGKAWEEAFRQSKPTEMRGVRLRTSFVIGKNGGALSALKQLVKIGLGGTVGKGKQGMSWIHEYDMNEIIYQSIINEKYEGVYISSAPKPESNKDFMKLLRKKMRIPFGIPSPEFMVRFGAKIIFRTDPELVLYGRYVKSERLDEVGYEFKYPELSIALDDLV